MSLMNQSTSFLILKKKYRDFAAPTVRIKVDGVEIIERKQAALTHLTVDLTSEYQASGCSFDIDGEYRPSHSDFDPKGSFRKLQIGAKVEVSLGYITTEDVFSGVVTEVEYRFDGDAAPLIHVECMDLKCLLMKTQRLELIGERKIKQAISTLLSQPPVLSYMRGKSIKIPADVKRPLGMHMKSDYDFIVQMAQYTGCEFFVFCGKVYFRRPPLASAPIMELSPDKGILYAKLRLQGAELVKKVKVVGINPEKDKDVSGSARVKGRFSKGATAKKMISGTERVYLDPLATDKLKAKARAKVLMDGLTNRFASLEIETVGLPELVPGRQVRVSGLSDEAKGGFYITNVHHEYGEDGFFTTVEAREDSL